MFDFLTALVISWLQLLESLEIQNALEALNNLHQAGPASLPQAPPDQKTRQALLGFSGEQSLLNLDIIL